MVAAIATGVSAILPTVSGSSLFSNSKDPERFQTAETLYYAARAGDADALCQLKYFSGRYGASPGCGKYGAGTSGFATVVAKDYAGRLYDQAVAIDAGLLPQSTPLPPRPKPSSNIPNVGQTLSGVSTSTGQVASQLGYPNRQEQQRNALIIVGVLVVGVLLFKHFAN